MQVEFFGIPRERAGVPKLDIHAETLGQLLGALADRFPSFNAFVQTDGQGTHLHPAFAANVNGERFVSDPATRLRESDSVLILSADAGG